MGCRNTFCLKENSVFLHDPLPLLLCFHSMSFIRNSLLKYFLRTGLFFFVFYICIFVFNYAHAMDVSLILVVLMTRVLQASVLITTLHIWCGRSHIPELGLLTACYSFLVLY